MYRTRHFRWKLMHLCGILSHLGLVVAVAVSYICDLSRTAQSIHRGWGHVTVVEMNSCRFAHMAGLGNGFTFDVATHTLLKACLVVGSLGFIINIALLAVLLAVEPNRIALTEGEQHWRKQIVTFFGCLLNLLLAGAGVFLALTLGTKAADSKPLIAPLIWTYIQWPLAFSMAVCDAVKNHREGKDLLD